MFTLYKSNRVIAHVVKLSVREQNARQLVNSFDAHTHTERPVLWRLDGLVCGAARCLNPKEYTTSIEGIELIRRASGSSIPIDFTA